MGLTEELKELTWREKNRLWINDTRDNEKCRLSLSISVITKTSFLSSETFLVTREIKTASTLFFSYLRACNLRDWGVLIHNSQQKNPDPLNREFKKLRRQLQRKRHIKTELCFKLSLLRLFHFDHVVQNRRSALLLAWHEWLSCKGKEWKIYRCGLALSSEPQIWKFHVVVW